MQLLQLAMRKIIKWRSQKLSYHQISECGSIWWMGSYQMKNIANVPTVFIPIVMSPIAIYQTPSLISKSRKIMMRGSMIYLKIPRLKGKEQERQYRKSRNLRLLRFIFNVTVMSSIAHRRTLILDPPVQSNANTMTRKRRKWFDTHMKVSKPCH